VFAAFKPKLPEKYRNSKFVFLANIAPDLQRDVLHQVKVRAEAGSAGHHGITGLSGRMRSFEKR